MILPAGSAANGQPPFTIPQPAAQDAGGGLLGSLLFGRQGFMGMLPQPIQQSGIVGSLVNAIKAGGTPQAGGLSAAPPPAAGGLPTTLGQPVIPGQGDPRKPGFDFRSVPFQEPPNANIASAAPGGILAQLFGGGATA